ncbi:MAG: FIST C-terminal domain-containing protein [Ignavibacteriales bacterium]|nr:FIST C-terminal domain-containing protein [Ignavibacteriales bacterium]
MRAKSIKGKSPEEIKNELAKSIADGFTPTLAIIFLSANLNRDSICKIFDEKGITIFGSTAAGEFINGELEKESAAILLLDMDKTNFLVHIEERSGKSKLRTAAEISKKGLDRFSNPAYLVATGGSIIDGETIISGINSASGKNSIVYGGIAGDELRGTETHLFTNNKSTQDGIIALIVDHDKIQLTGLASHGWKPIGTIRTITDCEDCKVYTIDDEPALDIMTKFLGISLEDYPGDELINNVGNLDPIQLMRDDGSTITRAIRNLNKIEKSILLAGPVTRGTKIRFSLPPDNNNIQQVTEECRYLKEIFQPQAEAMIMFSCIGRYYSLGPLVSSEIEEVKDVWDSPMAGFFCYGEIGNSLKGKQEFHNNTCCIVALKEK